MNGIKYCLHCKHDCGGWPCKKGHKELRNTPNSCADFEGELYVPQKKKVNEPVYEHEDFNGELTAYEICNTFNTDWQDHVLKTFKVHGSTLEECFKNAYPSQRSLRYCNGYRIQFRDKEIHERWLEWQHTSVTTQMYYGNGTVD